MRENVVFEEYSSDKQYRYQVCEEEKYYVVWLEERITDEHMGPKWFTYTAVRGDHKHITDNLDTAKEIGRECLRNLSGKSVVGGAENKMAAPQSRTAAPKRKISMLCVGGFVCSVLAVLTGLIGSSLPDHYEYFRRHANHEHLYMWMIAIALALAIVGLILSIIGVRSFNQRRHIGKTLGVFGILISTFVLLQIVVYFVWMSGIFAGPRESPPTFYPGEKV